MRPHRGTVQRLCALRGNVAGGERLDARRGMIEIEHDEVERGGEYRVIETREIGHLEVEVFVFDRDLTEQTVEHGHRQLAAPLGGGRVARG